MGGGAGGISGLASGIQNQVRQAQQMAQSKGGQQPQSKGGQGQQPSKGGNSFQQPQRPQQGPQQDWNAMRPQFQAQRQQATNQFAPNRFQGHSRNASQAKGNQHPGRPQGRPLAPPPGLPPTRQQPPQQEGKGSPPKVPQGNSSKGTPQEQFREQIDQLPQNSIPPKALPAPTPGNNKQRIPAWQRSYMGANPRMYNV